MNNGSLLDHLVGGANVVVRLAAALQLRDRRRRLLVPREGSAHVVDSGLRVSRHRLAVLDGRNNGGLILVGTVRDACIVCLGNADERGPT